MKVYQNNTCNQLYVQALKDCLSVSSSTPSRVGNVYDLGPVAFEFEPGKLNLLTLKNRALNPFFAIAEAAWVIGGHNELDILSYYLKKYDDFSDDGMTLNGAYGFRLRSCFGFDQLDFAIQELKNSPDSRRCVLNMYSADDLRNSTSKDIPCNTSIMLKIRKGALDLTVINRSNDVHWGIPYNIFVFQVLHCYLARKIGVELGLQRHFSDSLHLYEHCINDATAILDDVVIPDFESDSIELLYSIIDNIENINQRDFSAINDNSLRETMLMYSAYKNEGNKTAFTTDTGNQWLNFLVGDWSMKYAK
ncbi:Thymidylate synthase [Photobacterium damselae subsp. damselae]|uniref:thymidylate synthase n=1 Tax=Photobacterium damselae TaxID=38293 RepID=UPI00109B8E63|nr:thymidylate synthase [Photobacterium damselae]TGZ32496.1 Thymidylate synthase [Photobacterium damselae subsp. damselae]